jgi:high-affinity iron transporter
MRKIGFFLAAFSLTILSIGSLSLAGGDPAKGRTVYEAFCVGCHGFNGKGDGPDAADMNPKPTDLTAPAVTGKMSTEDIERAVAIGKPDTAMRGFGNILTKEDMGDLFTYLNSLMGK